MLLLLVVVSLMAGEAMGGAMGSSSSGYYTTPASYYTTKAPEYYTTKKAEYYTTTYAAPCYYYHLPVAPVHEYELPTAFRCNGASDPTPLPLVNYFIECFIPFFGLSKKLRLQARSQLEETGDESFAPLTKTSREENSHVSHLNIVEDAKGRQSLPMLPQPSQLCAVLSNCNPKGIIFHRLQQWFTYPFPSLMIYTKVLFVICTLNSKSSSISDICYCNEFCYRPNGFPSTVFAVDELFRTSSYGLTRSFGTCCCNVYVFRRYHTCPCANELSDFWYANKLLRCWYDELYHSGTISRGHNHLCQSGGYE
ncbi:Uncharacterized protein APZ42_028050 [Daphnia magna]|uniref:Uncharacterized protein n=1 Tax=Daphnia magna TaxID=35525 RepID=A0A162F323_9CRUS|nr:Uncharacterized protein APZ42_028050 [Daphnia magna]